MRTRLFNFWSQVARGVTQRLPAHRIQALPVVRWLERLSVMANVTGARQTVARAHCGGGGELIETNEGIHEARAIVTDHYLRTVSNRDRCREDARLISSDSYCSPGCVYQLGSGAAVYRYCTFTQPQPGCRQTSSAAAKPNIPLTPVPLRNNSVLTTQRKRNIHGPIHSALRCLNSRVYQPIAVRVSPGSCRRFQTSRLYCSLEAQAGPVSGVEIACSYWILQFHRDESSDSSCLCHHAARAQLRKYKDSAANLTTIVHTYVFHNIFNAYQSKAYSWGLILTLPFAPRALFDRREIKLAICVQLISSAP